MDIHNYKRIDSGSLKATFDLALPSGLVLNRCGLFEKGDRIWVSPPARQIIGRDGAVVRGVDGKVKYEPMIGFINKETQTRWSNSVIEALRAAGAKVQS